MRSECIGDRDWQLNGAQTMLLKFKGALSLYGRNLPLFAAIVLTVWLPIELAENYLDQRYPSDGSSWGSLWYSLPFYMFIGEVSTASLVIALYERKCGRNVTYFQAMSGGLRRWLPLIGANFVATLIALVGLLALIIPGIVLILRYSLIPFAVVLEHRGVTDSRIRSIQLTTGKRGEIFLAMVLLTLAQGAVFIPIDLLPTDYGFMDSIWFMTASGGLSSMVDGLFTAILFMYYWDAVEAEAVLTREFTPDEDLPDPATPQLASESE